MVRSLLSALVLGLTLAGPAQAFHAVNGMTVRDRGNGTFEVPFTGRSRVTDFWCAAGDYAARALGLPATARIWRQSEPPRRSGEGIRFSIHPEGAASASGLLRLSGKAPDLRVVDARALCELTRRR